MGDIPISAAERIATEYGWDQVVIVARKVGDDGAEHVTTYGVNAEHCGVAARIGDFLKHKIMGWPRDADDDAQVIRAAVAAEREACARIASDTPQSDVSCDYRGIQDPETGEVPCRMEDDCGRCACSAEFEHGFRISARIRARSKEGA